MKVDDLIKIATKFLNELIGAWLYLSQSSGALISRNNKSFQSASIPGDCQASREGGISDKKTC